MTTTRVGTRKTTAALYCRISSDQTGEALGVERQEAECRKLAKAKGWTVGAVYVDNDVSAYSGKPRPQYKKLLHAIESKQVGSIITWHPDRLHRSPLELEEFITLVDKYKVDVATVTAGFWDLSNASGRMQARNMGNYARYESEHKSERLLAQREQHAQAGKPHHGTRCFGYSHSHAVVPKEAAMIRAAVKRVLAGEPVASIAREWNAKGVTGTKGHAWTNQTVRQMLCSPRLAGIRVHQGVEYVAETPQWTPIISRADHDHLKAAFARRGPGMPPKSLLAGLLRCGHCGSTMQKSKQGKSRPYTVYRCHVAPGLPGCGRVSIRADHTEECIVELVLAHEDHRVDAARPDVRRTGNTVTDDGATITRLERKLDELADMYATDAISKREFLKARKTVDQELTAARQRLAEDTNGLVLSALVADGSVRDKWTTFSTDEQRRILGAVIAQVRVRPSETGGGRWSEDRLAVTFYGDEEQPRPKTRSAR